MSNGWTGGEYSLFRAIFGGYLCFHFLNLVPWGTELFSNRGMIPDASASPLLFVFPNALAWLDSPGLVMVVLLLAAGASVFLMAGLYARPAAVAIWYVWACLLGRNPLISNPGIPYVGWLLLAHACLPPVPHGSGAQHWRMPPAIFGAAWILMAVGYSSSGYSKLVSPSWVDGSGLARILDNPLARPGVVREMVLALPGGLLRIGTWGALLFELLFAAFALVRRLRPWIWTLAVAMHVSLIGLIDFADLSLGMVMLHLFTFDPEWIRGRIP